MSANVTQLAKVVTGDRVMVIDLVLRGLDPANGVDLDRVRVLAIHGPTRSPWFEVRPGATRQIRDALDVRAGKAPAQRFESLLARAVASSGGAGIAATYTAAQSDPPRPAQLRLVADRARAGTLGSLVLIGDAEISALESALAELGEAGATSADRVAALIDIGAPAGAK